MHEHLIGILELVKKNQEVMAAIVRRQQELNDRLFAVVEALGDALQSK